ncbi:DUF1648 domain-containing protein [Microbacterium sp. 179-I 3D3 NHS]|uniref:DUF1648 domain-containing protein n=1 Tax=Microbacterium sp. 179-I 3D3 NHS TaxID=3142382 RepID=UPI0039A1DD36
MTTHDITRTPPSLLRRARRTFFLVAVVAPLIISAAGVATLLVWLPSLPDEVATHWGVNGADAFGPPSAYLWIILGIGFAVPVIIATTTILTIGEHWGAAARLLGALAVALAAFATTLSLGSLVIQRDVSASDVIPGIEGVMAASFAAFAVVGAAAWAIQPRVRAEPGRTLEPKHAVRVADGERVVWLGTTSMPRAALAGLLVVLVALAGLAVFLLATGREGGWIVTVVLVVVAVALAATASFRVRVTPEGFAARSLLGWPRIVIPIDEIDSARAVEVSPFGEFGGWGWRVGMDGRSGIIMRSGPAIEVSRRGRHPFLVTIDGAGTASELLQAYVGRARAAGPARRAASGRPEVTP